MIAALAVCLWATGCGESDDLPAAEDETATSTSVGGDMSGGDSSQPDEPTTTVRSCGSGGSLTGPTQDRVITTADGRERSYLLAIPSTYDPATPAPVLFNLHGRGSNSAEQWIYGGFRELAERDGVILVMPQALANAEGSVQWNGGGTRPSQDASGPNDAAFINEIAAELATQYCTGDVWAAGMSSGGFMSSVLACDEDTDVKGIAPVTLAVYVDELCADAPPTPFVYFHGTKDEVVPFDGNPNRQLDSARTTAEEWADHNGCDPEPTETRVSGEVLHYSWNDCDAPTDFYVVEGGGHTWPGSLDVPGLGYVTRDISASEIIWNRFFGPS